MTGYESQCRFLLRAFPAPFRQERGEDLVSTLLDDAPPGARRVSPGTAIDLIVSGARMRAVHGGAAESVRRSASQAVPLAAVIGLGVQAALAVASAVYQGEHGVVFYVPVTPPSVPFPPLGSQILAVWIVLAALSTLAFAAAVRAAWRTAALLSVAVSVYLISVVSVSAASVLPWHAISAAGTPVSHIPGMSRYMAFASTPGLLAVGAVAAGLAVAAAWQVRSGPAVKRSFWWLAAAAVAAGVFALVGDGNAAQGGPSHLSTAYPPQGGIMTVLQVLVVAAMATALIWSVVDPRVGWAAVVVCVPFVVYQVSDLTLGSFYYGYLYQPGWVTALPLILALAGIAAIAGSATLTTRRLERR